MEKALMGITKDGKSYLIQICKNDASLEEALARAKETLPESKFKDYVSYTVEETERPDFY
ncbi:MAG: hypothetical protein IKW81_01385 [Pseudobutyrivibrio sp.]|nr:hypothetical protein [Pseudobutyrivibrio sp.]